MWSPNVGAHFYSTLSVITLNLFTLIPPRLGFVLPQDLHWQKGWTQTP